MDKIKNINENEILTYLGYKGQEITEDIKLQIKKCLSMIINAAQPRTVYRIFNLDKNLKISGSEFSLVGKDIKEHLKNCNKVVVMAATLGSKTEQIMMQLQIKNMADAVIADACASAAIEAVCNNLEENIREEFKKQNQYLTDRFSPGYGDMPISQQSEICRIIDCSRKIGLTVTPSNILVPRKSVTAVMGISKTPVKRRGKSCENCNMFKSCAYRKDGIHCGK